MCAWIGVRWCAFSPLPHAAPLDDSRVTVLDSSMPAAMQDYTVAAATAALDLFVNDPVVIAKHVKVCVC